MSTTVDPKGKVALVTGSTSGIGLATAHCLAKRGVNIILHGSRDKSLVTGTLEEIRSYGVSVNYVQCDLANTSNINSMWDEVLNLYSDGVDILINNAGIGYLFTLEDYPDDKYDPVMTVNVSAPYHLTKRCLPGMKKKGWGRIVNVSSVAGIVSGLAYNVYAASKHALNGFTKGVALETAQFGITCNAVCPGFTETAMAYRGMESNGWSMEDFMKNVVNEKHPNGKLIQPHQVGELIEFLCLSGASSQITGASYLIDGGWAAQ